MITSTADWNQRALLRDALKNQTITVIGAGNMGGALVTGLVEAGYDPLNIWVTAKTDTKLTPLHQKLGVHVTQQNEIAAARANILILAVKPQVLPDVLANLTAVIQKNQPLLLSMAAGINELSIREQVGKLAIVRAMPNTPIMIRCGVTALYANNFVNDRQKKTVQSIFDAVGETVWLNKESDIDPVTALSGSGPIYTFMLIQALQEAATAHGLSKEITKKLSLQTALGSAKMAHDLGKDMKQLCKEVASPGGGTEQAIKALKKGDLTSLVATAMKASLDRYKELAKK
jgi:pyrroline-5-carboxylate reductase